MYKCKVYIEEGKEEKQQYNRFVDGFRGRSFGGIKCDMDHIYSDSECFVLSFEAENWIDTVNFLDFLRDGGFVITFASQSLMR